MPLWAIGGLIFKVVLFGGAAFLIFCFVKALGGKRDALKGSGTPLSYSIG
jgi:hypothetical protein